MNNKSKRRLFLKQIVSLTAFGAGSVFSLKGNQGFRAGKSGRVKMGLSEALAGTAPVRVKKIACEEHGGGKIELYEKRLRDMDEAGIDMQVIQGGWNDPKKDNDFLAEIIHQKYPGRFAGYCALPWNDPDAASAELERAVKDLGLKAPMVYAGQHADSYLDNPKYWGIYETAANLNVPVYIHPGSLMPDMSGPYDSPYPIVGKAMWGFAALTGLHAVRLIVSGIFDKYPGLKIMLGHMGEGIPYWLWRMDKHYIDDRPYTEKDALGNNLKKLPSQYFKENFYITTSGMLWEPVLKFVISVMGADRVLFACDYPPEPDLVFAAKFIDSASISDNDREKICHLNVEKLLKI